MWKGHTRIELRNVETGETEVYEDDNLVTQAIDRIINMEMSINAAPNDYCLPVRAKALGGIMLFDDELEEDVENIHFPVDAHLVGYASTDVNTSDSHRGSYNSVESYSTENGRVDVWDFGTSQANGTIKAVARTSSYGGANPLRYMYGPRFNQRWNGAPQTDYNWYPIRYDGEYLYMLKPNSSTHMMRLARVKMPTQKMGATDYSNREYTYEVIATWDTEIYYFQRSGDRYIYADSVGWYKDGGDGYIYAVCGDGTNEDGQSINYFTIKYSDESYEKSEHTKVNIGVETYYYSETNYCRYFDHSQWHIKNRVLYFMSRSRKIVYIINLDNVAAKRAITIIPSSSNDYIIHIHNIQPHDGGVYLLVYHYTTTSYQYRNGILYPDGTSIILDIEGTNDQNWWGYFWVYSDVLALFGNPYSSDEHRARVGWVANYLGTINNLASAITKTSAQTMKIIYTLTDVDE